MRAHRKFHKIVFVMNLASYVVAIATVHVKQKITMGFFKPGMCRPAASAHLVS